MKAPSPDSITELSRFCNFKSIHPSPTLGICPCKWVEAVGAWPGPRAHLPVAPMPRVGPNETWQRRARPTPLPGRHALLQATQRRLACCASLRCQTSIRPPVLTLPGESFLRYRTSCPLHLFCLPAPNFPPLQGAGPNEIELPSDGENYHYRGSGFFCALFCQASDVGPSGDRRRTGLA